jgi:hypothetical protein
VAPAPAPKKGSPWTWIVIAGAAVVGAVFLAKRKATSSSATSSSTITPVIEAEGLSSLTRQPPQAALTFPSGATYTGPASFLNTVERALGPSHKKTPGTTSTPPPPPPGGGSTTKGQGTKHAKGGAGANAGHGPGAAGGYASGTGREPGVHPPTVTAKTATPRQTPALIANAPSTKTPELTARYWQFETSPALQAEDTFHQYLFTDNPKYTYTAETGRYLTA